MSNALVNHDECSGGSRTFLTKPYASNKVIAVCTSYLSFDFGCGGCGAWKCKCSRRHRQEGFAAHTREMDVTCFASECDVVASHLDGTVCALYVCSTLDDGLSSHSSMCLIGVTP
jgi:hypothetical protein